jgi:hypothetical protein
MYTWAIIILLMLVSRAGAQELPSEVDLRAAYCIPIAQENFRVWTSDQESLKEWTSDRELSELLEAIRKHCLAK